jgi:hypothetical protein
VCIGAPSVKRAAQNKRALRAGPGEPFSFGSKIGSAREGEGNEDDLPGLPKTKVALLLAPCRRDRDMGLRRMQPGDRNETERHRPGSSCNRARNIGGPCIHDLRSNEVRTIKRYDTEDESCSVELITGGRGFYAGRIYRNETGAFKARPRGLDALADEFDTENEALDALKDFWRPSSPVRRRLLNPTALSTRRRITHTTKSSAPTTARSNDPRHQSIRKRTRQHVARAGE